MSEWLDAYNAITQRNERRTMNDALPNITIETVDDEGMVRVRTDRPGERATSVIVNGRDLIAEIQTVLNITPSPVGDEIVDQIEGALEPEEEAPAL